MSDLVNNNRWSHGSVDCELDVSKANVTQTVVVSRRLWMLREYGETLKCESASVGQFQQASVPGSIVQQCKSLIYRDNFRVTPCTSDIAECDNRIGSIGILDSIASLKQKAIRADTSVKLINTRSAVESVVAVTGCKNIVTKAAKHLITPISSEQDVVPRSAIDPC